MKSSIRENLEKAFEILKTKPLKERFKPSHDFGREKDLKVWNRVQYLLWQEIVSFYNWNKNDGKKFIEFGKFFYDFWDKYQEIPELDDFLDFYEEI